MRRLVVGTALLLLLVALLPAVAATLPPTAVPASADPTAIEAVTPSAIVAGVPVTLVATLRDTAMATPVGGAKLTFVQPTEFGSLVLGDVTTNAQGEGGIQYEPAHNGTATMTTAIARSGGMRGGGGVDAARTLRKSVVFVGA